MFQKFYTDTLGSRYIKSLLSQTPIPIFDSVVDGDHLVSGCYYVYKYFIIKCVSSGILAVSTEEQLYPSDTLYPSIFLFPGTGYRAATFYVKSYIDAQDPKIHSTFQSSTNFYDSETHKYLSKYLRFLYTTKGLNLFPFYNFYSSIYFSDVELFNVNNKVTINRVVKQQNKVVGIPILFGHTYTISIDCPTEVMMRACIHDDSGFTEEDKLPKDPLNDSESIQRTLQNSGKIFTRLNFNEPVTFRIETSSLPAMQLQHNLYLLIQLPQTNDSSIVVLENHDSKTGIYTDENSVLKVSNFNLSLLKMNTRESYAFSTRLLEYLLGNVIYSSDQIAQNIQRVQSAIEQLDLSYTRALQRGAATSGVWDDDISRIVTQLLRKQKNSNILYDQDGNVNRDVEQLLYKLGGTY